MRVPRQAVVLCAGEGRRLLPYTRRRPKPLMPLLNVPLVQHQLLALQRAGVERVALNAWHLAPQIVAFAAADPVPGLRLHVEVETTLLGTGGGLANLRRWLAPEPLLLLAGDIVADFDFAALAARHAESGAQATMALTPRADVARYGAVEIDEDGLLTDIAGLVGRRGRAALVNASAHLLEPDFVRRLPDGPCCLVRQLYVPALVDGARCAGFVHEGAWAELGEPAALLAVQGRALAGELPVHPAALELGGRRVGEAFVHPTARVAADARLLRGTVVGPGGSVGRGVTLSGCLLLPGASVPAGRSLAAEIIDADPATETLAGAAAGREA
jgi:mannose-1-phosphate guanylyltransferase